MDDFELFSTEDRRDVSYVACVGGMAILGGAVGRFGMLPGLLGGAAVGLAIGLLTCKRLAPVIEKKLLSQSETLSEHELAQALRLVRDQTGVENKRDAMYLLATARSAMRSIDRSDMNAAGKCQAPRVAAAQLLNART